MKNSDELEFFEVVEDHAVFRPSSRGSVDEAMELIRNAIVFAREHGIGKLLVDTSWLTGFAPPRVTDRFHFVRQWGRAAGGAVRVAVVARPEMIDRQKFGVIAAANVGLISDVFTSEADALAWLLNP